MTEGRRFDIIDGPDKGEFAWFFFYGEKEESRKANFMVIDTYPYNDGPLAEVFYSVLVDSITRFRDGIWHIHGQERTRKVPISLEYSFETKKGRVKRLGEQFVGVIQTQGNDPLQESSPADEASTQTRKYRLEKRDCRTGESTLIGEYVRPHDAYVEGYKRIRQDNSTYDQNMSLVEYIVIYPDNDVVVL